MMKTCGMQEMCWMLQCAMTFTDVEKHKESLFSISATYLETLLRGTHLATADKLTMNQLSCLAIFCSFSVS